MRILISAVVMSLAMPAIADQPAATGATAPAKVAKPKKICREDPARTGSHMGGGRICKTAEQWRELDQADADTSTVMGGGPAASSTKQAD